MKRIASAAFVAFFSVLSTASAAPAREVTFPGSGLTLRLPALPSEWQMAPKAEGQFEAFLERQRPGAPGMAVSFSINGTRRADRCDEALKRVEQSAPLQPKPGYLPAGYYPTIAHAGTSTLLCADANGRLAIVLLEYEGELGSSDMMEVVPVLEAVRNMLASAPPSAAANKGTEVRVETLNLSLLLPEGWTHRIADEETEELFFSVPGRPTVRINLFSKYLDGRDCDWMLDQMTSGMTTKVDPMPANEYVKRWHPRGRAFGGGGKPGEPDVFAMLFCAEPRPDELVRAVVSLEGDLGSDQQIVAALTPMSEMLDYVMEEIERTPGWHAPSRGKSELRLPKAGITVQLPRGGAEWDLATDASGVEVLVRVRPAAPRITMLVSSRGKLSVGQCEDYLKQSIGKTAGRVVYSPAYLPVGWFQRVYEFAENGMKQVCGGDAAGRMLVAFPSIPATAAASDLADVKAMLERIGIAVGMPGVSVSTVATSSAAARPNWASAATMTAAPVAGAQASATSASASVPVPAPEPSPTSTTTSTYEAPSYSETPSHSYGSRLGQLYSLWYVGGLRSGGDHLAATYGGLVGNDRLYLVERGPLAVRLAGWLGYGPTDGLAGDAALAVGLGPIGDDEEWAVLAMTGVGVTRYGADLYPAAFVAHAELRGRLRLDSLGFEGALGYYPAAGYAEDSVRLDLRLYFALGQGQSWMVSWRRAIFEEFDCDQLVLGFGF